MKLKRSIEEQNFIKVTLDSKQLDDFMERLMEMKCYGESFTWRYNNKEDGTVLMFQMKEQQFTEKERKTKGFISTIFMNIMGVIYCVQLFIKLFVSK